ncbi:Glycoside hydrolase [Phytophthora palmivora]|uniref:Glycoside hydrolase n=1 Tax=Phytophthora palmivora TaxID=4796 RepID=A0A2P4YN57_9STRA|nr:Glycoside hydrolase [Phytophthora palmivora]
MLPCAEGFNKKFVELRWVYEDREIWWCCPALPVKKRSTNDYRQTVDYRPTNPLTEPIAGVMFSI